MTARLTEQIQLAGEALALLDTTPRPAAPSPTPSRRLTPAEALALPCYNRPGPWIDNEKRAAREIAALDCQMLCRQLDWCEQQRQETVELHGSAVGVWAGKIYTHADYRSDGKGEAA